MQLAFLNTHISKDIRRKAEKLMSNYRNLEAVIEAKKVKLSPKLTVSYGGSEAQRGNQFYSQVENEAIQGEEISEYETTLHKLNVIFDSLKPEQQEIWLRRYVLGQYDTNVYMDMDMTDRKYYRLKREMIAIVADAFDLFSVRITQ